MSTTIYKPMFIKDEAEKEIKMNEQFDVIVPKFLDEINDRCKSGWLVGDKITIADFFIGGLYINYLTNEHVAYGKIDGHKSLKNIQISMLMEKDMQKRYLGTLPVEVITQSELHRRVFKD